MDVLKHILTRYNITEEQKGPHYISAGRYKCLPNLFNELGFKTGAEVGVHRAQWSAKILRRVPGLKLFLIDLWEAYPGYKDFEKTTIVQSYKDAQDNTKGRDVIFMKEWSHIAADQFEDESLDFVYLDANHAYEFVVRDLAKWAPKVRKGGIVCGHDYDDYTGRKRQYDMNVINAVNGWCDSYGIKHLFILTNNPNNSWMYVK